MNNSEKLAVEILGWAKSDIWYSKLANRLKAKNLEYMVSLIEKMETFDEYAMNRAASKMAITGEGSDKNSRIVHELICVFTNKLIRETTKVFPVKAVK